MLQKHQGGIERRRAVRPCLGVSFESLKLLLQQFDGASKRNPGLAGAGAVLIKEATSQEVITSLSSKEELTGVVLRHFSLFLDPHKKQTFFLSFFLLPNEYPSPES